MNNSYICQQNTLRNVDSMMRALLIGGTGTISTADKLLFIV
jgi:hypothetical protein